MTMRDLLRWLLVAAAVLTADAAATARDIDGVPLPDGPGVLTAAPGPFSGAWVGRWGGELKHILIVRGVAPDGKADVIYAVGDRPGIPARHLVPDDARVINDELRLTVNSSPGSNFKASYYLASANWMQGFFEGDRGKDEVELKRISFAALPNTKFADTEGESIMIDSGLPGNGHSVRLEVVIFKPAVPGPFPLLVVNHGSTGDGTNRHLFTRTFARRAFAEIFVSKGYLVAYPQRRGRGKSEGVYDEGFKVNHTLGYTCEPVPSLAGADRALEDITAAINALRRRADVAPGPVLVAGHSRGGALSIAYAGMHPNDVAGVINFVGGWLGNKGECQNTASAVNTNLLLRGASFPRSTLWLYGDDDDPFYTTDHSDKNFAAFKDAHGKGKFKSFNVPGLNGHYVMFYPSVWKAAVDNYLH